MVSENAFYYTNKYNAMPDLITAKICNRIFVPNLASLRNVTYHWLARGFRSLKVPGLGCRMVCFAKGRYVKKSIRMGKLIKNCHVGN